MIPARLFTISNKAIILSLIGAAFIGVAVSYSNFYLFHLILLILSIVWFYQLKENKYKLDLNIFLKKYVPTLLIIFIWYSFSLFWTPNLELGLKYLFYIVCGITISISIISFSSNIENLNKIFYLLSIFFFIEIAIALLESFSSFRMPISSHSSLAILFGKDSLDLSRLDNIFLYSNIKPPTGFHWNTNDLAICMIIALPFFLCSKKTIIKIFGILSITTIVVMTASRAVFLALILIYSLYLFFIKKRIGTLTLIWLTSGILSWGMFQLNESENPRINELANSTEALVLYLSGDIDVGGSLEWRRELVDSGIKAFLNSYGLGLGAGGSVANQQEVGPVAGRFTSMHNFWVELLVEGGLIVAILVFFWLFGIIYQLFIIQRTTDNKKIKYYSESLFLSMIAFIPGAVAGSSTIYFFPMWIMFGFSIAVIAIHKNEIPKLFFKNN